MTASLETFAKVRVLHDRTASAGEKASAADRMKTLARKAGMSVEEAVSRLDAPKPRSPAQATAESFAGFMNPLEFVAQRRARQARRWAKAAAIVEQYGSEKAQFADTPMKAALRASCQPLLGPGETWRTIDHLDGWGALLPRQDTGQRSEGGLAGAADGSPRRRRGLVRPERRLDPARHPARRHRPHGRALA